MFVAMRICRIPLHINFSNPDLDYVEGVGFAWTSEMAQHMVGRYNTLPPKATRSVRRAMKRAAQATAKDLYHADSEK